MITSNSRRAAALSSASKAGQMLGVFAEFERFDHSGTYPCWHETGAQ
jgi:hypothetical protein